LAKTNVLLIIIFVLLSLAYSDGFSPERLIENLYCMSSCVVDEDGGESGIGYQIANETFVRREVAPHETAAVEEQESGIFFLHAD
jgi:hypothetical protein